MSDEHGPDDNYDPPKSQPLAFGNGSAIVRHEYWRLLELGEMVLPGDEQLRGSGTKWTWMPACDSPETAYLYIEEGCLPIRRKVKLY